MPFATGTVIGLLRDPSGALTKAITQAQATADNARQMVLNRDSALKNLQADAATLPDIVNAASVEHAEMREEMDSADAALGARIDAIQLTPGPKGDEGDQGPQGDRGAQGPQGATGDVGLQGLVGDTGPQGKTGADGPTGPPGPKGDKGDSGPAGPQGEIGPAGPKGTTGTTGATGPSGAKGDTGAAGATGPAGADGKLQALATGTLAVPGLALGASADLTVPLSRAMPNTNYNVDVIPAAALLSSMTWTVKTKNLNSVVINVKAGLLVSTGASITVIASV